jgi:Chemotaxis protein
MAKKTKQDQKIETLIEREIESASSQVMDKDSFSLLAARVATEIVHELGDKNSEFFKELRQIVSSIDSAKDEIAAIRPKELAEKELPDAANALDIIIKTSEEAATEILACGEELMEIAQYVPSKLNQRLMEIATKIFEASNFDDLNGQRIRKVIKTLHLIEDRLKGLLNTYGEAYEVVHEKAIEESSEDALLNGPQDQDKATSQEEIDRILNGG